MPQKFTQVSYLYVNEDETGQRLDNWLMARLKGLPRSRVYRIIRSGEVRVNKGRAKAARRLESGDAIRVPPVSLPDPQDKPGVPEGLKEQLKESVLYRDADILAINKPAGTAVHGGSGVRFGVIDGVREIWGDDWQLVHRLDRETSGCLLLVRKRELQREFQQALSENRVSKCYQALAHGLWPAALSRIESRLERRSDAAGERRVRAADGARGQIAVSFFEIERSLPGASLLEVRIETGRTHQIRVQAAEAGHPLVGDSKYGRRELDKALGLQRPPLCLHARALHLELGGRTLGLSAPRPEEFEAVIRKLEVPA